MRRVRTYLGRRGSVLLLIGTVWVLRGLLLPWRDEVVFPPDAMIPHLSLPMEFRVGLWVVTGSVAIACALLNRPRLDAWGFGALVAPPLELTVSFAWSVVVFVMTGGELGWFLAIAHALGWSAVLMILLIVAGWQENTTVRVVAAEPEED